MTFSLPTLSEAKAAAISVVVVLWTIYKKEIQDWLKAFLSACKNFLVRLYTFLFIPAPAHQLTESESQVILNAGLGALETYLWVLQKEYAADRVTVTKYEEQADGSARVTCLREVKNGEILSVRDLKQTPIPLPLWTEIKRIGLSYPGRARYVPDARTEENAAVKAALLSSSACTAYYEMMPDPEGRYETCYLLALSWHAEHPLGPAQFVALHNSGIACNMVLVMTGLIDAALKK